MKNLVYRRDEGMCFRPGIGFMWDHVSRGVLLMIGKAYLWVRWSVRVNRLFVRAGILRKKEIYCEQHPDFNEKGELK